MIEHNRRTRRSEPITKRTAKNGAVSYTFQADVGVKPDGSRDRRRFTYPTIAKARKEYRRITTEVSAGTYVAGHTATLGEFLARWLDGRRDVRPVTLAGYRHALKPVVDRLGGLGLQQLTKAHVDDLVEWRMASGRNVTPDLSESAQTLLTFISERGDAGVTYAEVEAEFGGAATRRLDRLRSGGYVERPSRGRYVAAKALAEPEQSGVSARTVTTMLVQLSAALDAAMAEGLVARNVARLVERPKVTPTEMKAWTAAQAATFRAHVAGRRDYALWLLTLAGMRRSEVLGLTWKRVDLEAGTLTIASSRVVVAGGTDTGDPKSWRSRRTLRLPDDVLAALHTFKATQAAERLAIGAAWSSDTDLVAVREDGTPIRPEAYSAEFTRLVNAAGLPVSRLHDARHTAASVLLAAGFSPVAAAKWLGHDPALTLRVYGHSDDKEQEAIGAQLFGGGSP
ncbi:site-specific integrase [Gordonia sp. CPCC 205333]|uniref:site-specific integrase n=1 Tax=Gordonia sp. CPCC 205333 TaxID=3140790 RepID=UPI003AF35C8A